MKKCPYCAEEIQDDAVKCKHCGEFLNKEAKDIKVLEPIQEEVKEIPKGEMKEEVICPNPNCGYKGPAIKEQRGSTAMGCFLLLLGLLPGILYIILMPKYVYICPKCGIKIKSGGSVNTLWDK